MLLHFPTQFDSIRFNDDLTVSSIRASAHLTLVKCRGHRVE